MTFIMTGKLYFVANILLLSGLAIVTVNTKTLAHPSPQLKFVVRVDGKSFYSDTSPLRNWTDASLYCETMGMKLASITSASQFSALDAAYSPDFQRCHWTSGRDALALRQFSWNATEEPLSTEYLRYNRQSSIPFLSCVAFCSEVGESFLSSTACSTNAGFTLCEI